MKTIKRDSCYLQAVRELEYCVICGAHGVQAAHENEGKGVALKVDDRRTAALCDECHSNIDNGPDLTKEERRRLLRKAVKDTEAQLKARGIL